MHLFAAAVAVYTELNTTRGEVAANLGTFDSAEQHFYDTIDSVPSGAGTHRTVVGVHEYGVHMVNVDMDCNQTPSTTSTCVRWSAC